MRIKLEWLNELVDLSDISIDELVNKISLYSIEVEGLDRVVSGTNLVIGHVLTKTPHPDSDHLNVLTVDVKEEVLQIVCGAPNVEAGQYVIVAKLDAVLPGDFKIKKSKIRGVESFGMVCSLAELGMDNKYVPSEYEKGIYYFKDEVEVGSPALKALNFDDVVIELGLTPNRADLMSYIGVAIELAAVFNRPLKKLAYDIIYEENETKDYLDIEIATDKCLTYYGAILKDVEIKESPRWLSSRLIAFGCRSINNVVDITNYVLALFGQPLHSFDADKLGSKILVRNAIEGEELVTLDGEIRKLEETDIVITDGKSPVCLGGVMGGASTEVDDNTKNIVLEAAVFDPMSIRKTSSRLALRSESSQRFERGVDLNRTPLALQYACYLMQKLANAKVYTNPVVAGQTCAEDKIIEVSIDYINGLLGTSISESEAVNIFERLGFNVLGVNPMKVSVPNRRLDILVKADLAEEVGKLYGYEKLPQTLPIDRMAGGLTNTQARRRLVKHTLADLGLKEVVGYSLVSTPTNSLFTYNHKENSKAIELLMPMTEERKEMRKSLVPSIVEIAKYNVNRKVKDVSIFEVGRTYYNLDGQNHEEETLAICMVGRFSDTLWNQKQENVDFFLTKGIINTLMEKLGLTLEYAPIDQDIKEMHPKRTAKLLINGANVGFVGELHPKYAKENDLPGAIVCEIKLDSILSYVDPIVRYSQISKVPPVERDLAIVLDKGVLAGDVVKAVKGNDRSLEVKVFDLYTGENVKENEKSLALKLIWTVNDTLTEDVINQKVNKVLKTLSKQFNATLRG